MKRLLLFVLILAPFSGLNAETTEFVEFESIEEGPLPITVEDGVYWVRTGNSRIGYTDLKQAEEVARSAALLNRPPNPHQKAQSELLKNLGIGELERLALSWSRYEDAKVYRGANTDLLFTMLEYHELASRWEYITWTIGVVADEAAAKKLADYISTPVQLDTDSAKRRYVQTRSGALSGLALATKERPMPWVNDYLMTHADPEQWIKIFKEKDLEIGAYFARRLAGRAVNAIAQLEQGDPLAMLQEVRARRLAKRPIQPFAASEDNASTVEYIDSVIEHLKRRAEAGGKRDCSEACP